MSIFHDLLDRFPEQRCITKLGVVGYREAGTANNRLPIVLLHGIGSGAASWVCQLDVLGRDHHVLAWDAPGYGATTPVDAAQPQADDYGQKLAAWLDAMNIERCILVAHSLGAIMASAFAGRFPQQVQGLLLLSPAIGYGKDLALVRSEKRDSRLRMAAELGMEGMAEKRSANLLSANAGVAEREWIRWNMARIPAAGYAQATHLLANADVPESIATYDGPLSIAVGSADAITPPEKCQQLAAQLQGAERSVPFYIFDNAGHACYVEDAKAVTQFINEFAATVISILRNESHA
ncbi:alpha/beta fold hydrolase [Glaciimonas soli]|uniref:Alpha/beta fold hydrolase n=1 Tax=Glaciimonas soli TaxID=2590999 RepID=A0A843YNS6_9BURK|nr:alpha/beta hydrolase [Glaciimonas soli]MQQ99636.1 alpha/beta fold hydrolase [Glaciimonas soli]